MSRIRGCGRKYKDLVSLSGRRPITATSYTWLTQSALFIAGLIVNCKCLPFLRGGLRCSESKESCAYLLKKVEKFEFMALCIHIH